MTAGEILVDASTAADGSTAAIHLLSIQANSKTLGVRLASELSTQTSTNTTEIVGTSDLLSLESSIDNETMALNIESLEAELCR